MPSVQRPEELRGARVPPWGLGGDQSRLCSFTLCPRSDPALQPLPQACPSQPWWGWGRVGGFLTITPTCLEKHRSPRTCLSGSGLTSSWTAGLGPKPVPGEFPISLTLESTLLTSLLPPSAPEPALIEELSDTRWKKPKGMKVTALYSILRAF